MNETSTNRPKDNPLFQQRLQAWKPVLSFKDAAIFFIITGIVVLILGILIFTTDQNVKEFSVEYTNCLDIRSGIDCSTITNMANSSCSCAVQLQISAQIQPPVYFYYGMNNFYQNHRQLIKSYDMNQLMGKTPLPNSACAPLLQDSSSNYYAPCGQMANVIFNDTFTLMRNSDNVFVPWTSLNISQQSDKKRYGIPSNWNNTVKPVNWAMPVNTKYPNAYSGAEELLVWMRPSPLPKFRKLHRILNLTGSFKTGLGIGNYTININYSYPVKSFGGQKFFIVTNLSWVGGKNPALGILYLVTGSVEILIGIIILILHLKNPTHQARSNSFDMSSRL